MVLMLRKVKSIFKSKKNNTYDSEWLQNKPVDRTLCTDEPLPDPLVSRPTPAQLNGDEMSDFPGYIALEVTNTCNLKCKHCNYRFGLDHYTRDRGFMQWGTLEKVLNEAKQDNINILMNYDGEPLMHKSFLDYLKYATELGLNTYFNTNGTLFNKDFADSLITFYKGSIFFSIDGGKEWLEKVRVPAKYEQVTKNLNYFLSLNKAHGWPITVGVSLCNLGQTTAERKEFLDSWLPRVNYVSMGEVNDKFGTMISDPMTVLDVKKRPICVVPWQTCGICHNGDVIPCSIYVTRANTVNAIFGNIHEKSLKEIWQGSAFRAFRKMVAEECYDKSYCDKCQRWLSQFSFPDKINGDVKIVRNGYWTTFHNMLYGKLNFQKKS
jgi:radical SAM protein with 4Fe4S-binding SPASM domain